MRRRTALQLIASSLAVTATAAKSDRIVIAGAGFGPGVTCVLPVAADCFGNPLPDDGVLLGNGFSELWSLSNTRKMPQAPLSSANVRVL